MSAVASAALDTLIALDRDNPGLLFEVGRRIVEMNPSRVVPGPPPGWRPRELPVLVLRGVVPGHRTSLLLAHRHAGMSLRQAKDAVDALERGEVTRVVPVGDARRGRAQWEDAGAVCDLEVEAPPESHVETLREHLRGVIEWIGPS